MSATDFDPDRVPSTRQRIGELVSFWPRLWRAFGHMGPRGPEGGPPAIVFPGFLASDRGTMELRRALAEAGFRVHPWRQGWNLGVRPDLMERLGSSLDQVNDDRPVLLVGWSLGGVFARELARARPDRTSAVVTLGSPFSGDPKQNNVWRLYELVAGHKVDKPPVAYFADKPPVPTLALWSRKDGIVAPTAAMGREGEADKVVELDCGHMAFGSSMRATRAAVHEIRLFLDEQEDPESRH